MGGGGHLTGLASGEVERWFPLDGVRWWHLMPVGGVDDVEVGLAPQVGEGVVRSGVSGVGHRQAPRGEPDSGVGHVVGQQPGLEAERTHVVGAAGQGVGIEDGAYGVGVAVLEFGNDVDDTRRSVERDGLRRRAA